MSRRKILLRLADPVLMLIVTALVLGLALVAQFVVEPRQQPNSEASNLLTVSGWTIAAFFAVATTICWTVFATYAKLVEISGEAVPEPRVFARSTSINSLLLERVASAPRGVLIVQCHGDRGFAGLLYDEGLPGNLSRLEVRICDVGVASLVDRDGIRALVQHLSQTLHDPIELVHLNRQPSTRIALLKDRAGNPLWLSVSFYSSHASGLSPAESSPTLVFTRFDRDDSLRMLHFAEAQLQGRIS